MKSIKFGMAIGAALLMGSQMAHAAPVAPSASDIQHLWLFDETVGTIGSANYGTPEANGGPTLQAARTASNLNPANPIPLVGQGTPVEVAPIPATTTSYSATPFSYAGNQSALIDWYSPVSGQTGVYPVNRFGLGTNTITPGSVTVGSEGAISFWYNPIFHDQANGALPGDDAGAESYFFALRSAGSDRLMLRFYRYNDGRIAYGFVDHTGSYSGDLAIVDMGVDYTGIPNGSPSQDWYNIVLTWGADGLSYYVNGQLLATDASFSMNSFDVTQLFVGNHNASTAAAPGLYDEFALWNTQLSAENVEWLAANGINALSDSTPVVPEPTTAGLFALGAAALAFRRSRHQA